MRFAVVSLLFVATAALPGSTKDLDAKNGFRDLGFGVALGSVQGLEPAGKDGVLDLYRRPADKLEIGNVPLESIQYGFFQGQFYKVVLRSPSKDDGYRLLSVLHEQYGSGKGIDNGTAWVGKKVTIAARLDEDGKAWTIYFISRPLLKSVQKAEEEAAKKAADDL